MLELAPSMLKLVQIILKLAYQQQYQYEIGTVQSEQQSQLRCGRFPDFYLSHIYQSDFCQATFTHHTFTHQDFYLSLVLALKKTFTHQDIHPSGHSPIRTFTHLFYFILYKQRSKKKETQSFIELEQKVIFPQTLAKNNAIGVCIAKPCFAFPCLV